MSGRNRRRGQRMSDQRGCRRVKMLISTVPRQTLMSPPRGAMPTNSNSNLRPESLRLGWDRIGQVTQKAAGPLIIANGNYALRVLLPIRLLALPCSPSSGAFVVANNENYKQLPNFIIEIRCSRLGSWLAGWFPWALAWMRLMDSADVALICQLA